MGPPYKKPPIAEAICEFTFTPSQNPDAHFLTLPGKLHTELKSDYPGQPRQQRLQSVAQLQGDALQISVQDELFRVQFPNAEANRLLLVGPNVLAVSMQAPYTSWDDEFRPRIAKALNAYMKIAAPLNVNRIGIRCDANLQRSRSGAVIRHWC